MPGTPPTGFGKTCLHDKLLPQRL